MTSSWNLIVVLANGQAVRLVATNFYTIDKVNTEF